MRSWHRVSLALVLITPACFNPNNSELDTDGSSGTTAGSTTAGATSATQTTTSGTESTTEPSSSTTLDPTDATGTTGNEAPDWGEGDPPDFGDLGPAGDGSVLVVHALATSELVDVWLVGDTSPVATDLAPGEAIRLEGIPREARRVVLAAAGTTDAVGCSDWFPLRAEEQWAVVAARASHTCANPVSGGASITFEQDLPLSENPLRFVHAGVPDDLSLERNGTPEPGTLSPLEELAVSDLPDCASSGCEIGYGITNAGLALLRDFSFQAVQVSEVPPPGEVLLVVLGDLRQDWPQEPDAMQLIRVDIDGATTPIGRDPEVAVFNLDSDDAVDFRIPAPPSIFTFATEPRCDFGDCVVSTQRFAPGLMNISAMTPMGSVGDDYDLQAGHRYVLAYTQSSGGELFFWEDGFDRADATVSTGRGLSIEPLVDTLTIGRVFGMMGQPFDRFIDLTRFVLSEEQDLPAADWSLVSAVNNGGLGSDCFSPVSTPAGWRGLVSSDVLIDLTAWPPQLQVPGLVCA